MLRLYSAGYSRYQLAWLLHVLKTGLIECNYCDLDCEHCTDFSDIVCYDCNMLISYIEKILGDDFAHMFDDNANPAQENFFDEIEKTP